jgi:hypothetical protein
MWPFNKKISDKPTGITRTKVLIARNGEAYDAELVQYPSGLKVIERLDAKYIVQADNTINRFSDVYTIRPLQ